MSDKQKPEQPPNPSRRKLFTIFTNRQAAGELGAELGKLNRELNELGRDLAQTGQELGDSLMDTDAESSVSPSDPSVAIALPHASSEAPPTDPQIAELLAQMAALTATFSTFAEQSVTNQAQTRLQLEDLAATISAVQEQKAQLEQSPHPQNQEAARQLDKRLAVLIATVSTVLVKLVERTADALFDGWVQENLLPLLPEWVQQPWRAFARGEQPVSPLVQPPSPVSSPESPLLPPADSPMPQRSTWNVSLPDLVRVPAGWFLMGSDKSKDPMARDDERPQHWVWLGEYWIGKYPVTNAQYAAFVLATGYKAPLDWNDGIFPAGQEMHPARNVSWHDARFFCDWLSRTTGGQYRLPTEAEWEKAARGTDGRIWPWGDQPPDDARCNFNNKAGHTTAVGDYPRGASPFGALDMAGNVWEWTSTLWRDDKYTQEFKYPYNAADGRERIDGLASAQRVVRGGAFYSNDFSVRCAARLRDFPSNVNWYLGFRVVLSPFTSGL